MAAILLLLALACSHGSGGSDDATRQQGELLFRQLEHSYPHYDQYEMDHELVVRSEEPERVMELLGLRPGEVVADVGCGSGFYTFELARAVGPEGRVYAVDIQEQALDYARRRGADRSLNPYDNVVYVLGRVDGMGLPAESLDAELLVHADFYAYPRLLPENVRMLQSLYRSLEPGGRLVVVQDMTVVPTATREGIQANFEGVGFVLDEVLSQADKVDLYLRFLKPGARGGGDGGRAPAPGPAPASSTEGGAAGR